MDVFRVTMSEEFLVRPLRWEEELEVSEFLG